MKRFFTSAASYFVLAAGLLATEPSKSSTTPVVDRIRDTASQVVPKDFALVIVDVDQAYSIDPMDGRYVFDSQKVTGGILDSISKHWQPSSPEEVEWLGKTVAEIAQSLYERGEGEGSAAFIASSFPARNGTPGRRFGILVPRSSGDTASFIETTLMYVSDSSLTIVSPFSSSDLEEWSGNHELVHALQHNEGRRNEEPQSKTYLRDWQLHEAEADVFATLYEASTKNGEAPIAARRADLRAIQVYNGYTDRKETTKYLNYPFMDAALVRARELHRDNILQTMTVPQLYEESKKLVAGLASSRITPEYTKGLIEGIRTVVMYAGRATTQETISSIKNGVLEKNGLRDADTLAFAYRYAAAWDRILAAQPENVSAAWEQALAQNNEPVANPGVRMLGYVKEYRLAILQDEILADQQRNITFREDKEAGENFRRRIVEGPGSGANVPLKQKMDILRAKITEVARLSATP